MINSDDIIKQLEKRLGEFSSDPKVQNVGTVVTNNDGVITASGLSLVQMGEIVAFDKDTFGVVLNLNENTVSIIALGPSNHIKEGDTVKRTEKLLSITVSESLLGRVVNPLGVPLDNKPAIKKGKPMPLERIAAGVIERKPVDTPLKTGIKAIDAMIPIGRGQRELIIGDRGLGKTAIAIDTIINQRQAGVVCIYVAIGQKQSTVAQIIGKLQDVGAMDYTIIVAANSADPAALQYLAPFAGVTIAEYFMEKGQDVLIVYDDLTKHAWAYRQISLVLRRPAGREAYPGDIFYLHSRLLERAVQLNDKNGGGSITALPIIETQAGDISAYIPTNVISITDGQIFLQGDLFNIGIRPAINVGNSVSRVGGAAQTGSMKSVAGKIRLDLAQYRSLEAFAQFGSDLDATTTKQLERGKRMVELLKQPQYQPLTEELEVVTLWAITNGYVDDVPVESCQKFEKELHAYVSRKPKVIKAIRTGKKIDEETGKLLKKTIEEFKKGFSA